MISLEHLADLAENPKTTIQVIPASAGAHAGLLGGFVIADLDGSPGMVYLETAAEGQIADSPASWLMRCSASMPSGPKPCPGQHPVDLILKVAGERWT